RSVESQIDWGKINQPMSPETFDRLLKQAQAYANTRELFVLDAVACADPKHRLALRVVAEQAWHTHFSHCLFLKPTAEELKNLTPEWFVLAMPSLRFDAKKEGLNSPAVIAVSFERKTIL